MTLLWTWSGTFFGYREKDTLWAHDGRHIGWFHGDEVYGFDCSYLGEIESENRLVTRKNKKHLRAGVYAALASRAGIVRYANYVGFAMIAGCEDFPTPEDL